MLTMKKILHTYGRPICRACINNLYKVKLNPKNSITSMETTPARPAESKSILWLVLDRRDGLRCFL